MWYGGATKWESHTSLLSVKFTPHKVLAWLWSLPALSTGLKYKKNKVFLLNDVRKSLLGSFNRLICTVRNFSSIFAELFMLQVFSDVSTHRESSSQSIEPLRITDAGRMKVLQYFLFVLSVVQWRLFRRQYIFCAGNPIRLSSWRRRTPFSQVDFVFCSWTAEARTEDHVRNLLVTLGYQKRARVSLHRFQRL